MPRQRAPLAVRRAQRTLAESVASWRKLRGLTQAQLAERADVSRDLVRRLEGGDGGVSIEKLASHLREHSAFRTFSRPRSTHSPATSAACVRPKSCRGGCARGA